MTILSKNAIFRPKTELEAIARWSVDASREVDCAYFGNIGRNSGYFLLLIFLGSYLTAHCTSWGPVGWLGGLVGEGLLSHPHPRFPIWGVSLGAAPVVSASQSHPTPIFLPPIDMCRRGEG